ncbi:VWA domain-containing protein [Clostridium sp.]|uniref:VWA domain-containing protein n=1 Tax=Clostridium sp. TaxID=1506 RepID=UPI00321723C0
MRRKINYKFLLSIVLVICIGATLIGQTTISAEAEVTNKPSFDVNITSVNPNPAKIGEDITVKGVITPKPFESEVPSKEIVLVLDVSGSMEDTIQVECTNERVNNYCTIHRKTDCKEDKECNIGWIQKDRGGYYYWYCYEHSSHVGWDWNKPKHCSNYNNHNIVDNYCIEHNKEGSHSTNTTKISELKKAAKSFVEKMKNEGNLKIGIAAYSSEAAVNPNGKDNNNPYKNVTSLGSNSSHQIPNYKSIEAPFLDINDSRLESMIDGLEALGGTNTGDGLRKAEYMLENGDSNANKTIVLMSDGLPTFYSVASSQKDFYKTIDKTNPRFAGTGSGTDDTAVSYATQIGGIIKETANNVFSIGYGLGDTNSNSNKTLKKIHGSMGGGESNFFASDDGAIDKVFDQIATEILKTYAISNIEMEMNLTSGFELSIGGNIASVDSVMYTTDGVLNNGRVTYKAEPVNFEFIIKGNNAGDYNKLFDETQVKFPWNGEIITVDKVNSLPISIINNELPNIEAKLIGDTTNLALINQDVTVTYEIKPESFRFQDNQGKLVPKDVAIVMDLSQGLDDKHILKEIKTGLTNHLLKKLDSKNDKVNYGLVTYNEAIINTIGLGSNDNMMTEIGKLQVTKSNKRNIGLAMEKAIEVLSSGRVDSNKFVILISSGDVIYTEEQIETLKAKNYNVISLEIQSPNSINKRLEDVHNELGGNKEDYFISIPNNGGNHNDIQSKIIKDIEDRISVNNYMSYVFSKAKLNFNIGDELKVVSGLKLVEDNPLNNYVLNLPEIKYIYDNGEYKSNPFEVSFVIKPTKHGKHIFKDKNEITYNSLIGNPLKKNIVTPTILVSAQEDIKHGIYNGVNGTEKSIIIDTVERTLAKESSVTFAAAFETYNNKAAIGLKIDKNIQVVGKPKVYRIAEDGSLKLLGEMTNEHLDLGYSYTLPEGVKEKDDIVVLYSGVLPVEIGTYTNMICVDGSEESATVKVGEDNLPDLF